MSRPPTRRDIRDPRALRALAHPLRLRMLDALRFGGPATATMLARRFRESTGATSYHLRQLARYGFIEEDRTRGTARERWWRAVPADFRVPSGRGKRSLRGAVADLAVSGIERDHGLLEAFMANRERFEMWTDSVIMSNTALRLTPDELAELRDRLYEVAFSFRGVSQAGPPEARPVVLLMYGFPWAAR